MSHAAAHFTGTTGRIQSAVTGADFEAARPQQRERAAVQSRGNGFQYCPGSTSCNPSDSGGVDYLCILADRSHVIVLDDAATSRCSGAVTLAAGDAACFESTTPVRRLSAWVLVKVLWLPPTVQRRARQASCATLNWPWVGASMSASGSAR